MMSLTKMRMEESSKSKLVLDFLNLGYPQAFPRRIVDKATGNAGLWLGYRLTPRFEITDSVV